MTSHLEQNENAYTFTFDSLTSKKPLKLEEFRGQVLLVVNTASKCGFTSQYKELEALYTKYHAAGLTVIGVPCNDFGAQEPGTSDEILNFCEINYGVTFPLTAKTSVRGKTAHPFYVWIKKQLGFGTGPKWNFHKYLIDRRGAARYYFHSIIGGENKDLISKIELLLSESALPALSTGK